MRQTDNKRIAKNTLLLYVRMGIVMLVSLYTSRIILNSLGVVNYGIYSVVGGVIALLGFINSSMSIAVQRFLSFALGERKEQDVNNLFSLSVIIHLIIALVVGFIFLISGNYIIDHFLDIPEDRIISTRIFFKWIILSTCINVIQVPYTGLAIAYEKMSILTWSSIADVLMKLLGAFAVSWISYDVLILYGYFIASASCLCFLLLIFLCRFKIKTIQFKLYWNNSLFKQILSFASWSALGEMAWALTLQGSNILLNIFVGVIYNAAYGIATQISGAVNKFVSSFTTAVNPQIIKLCAVNEMTKLTLRSIKFSFFLVLIIGLPLIVRMNVILKLWLDDVPQYAVIFSQMIVCTVLIDCLSNPLSTIAKAYGKIRKYQLCVAFVLSLNFPFDALVLKINFPPVSILFVYCIISFSLLIVRIKLVSNIIKRKISHDYLVLVAKPALKVLLGTVLFNCCLKYIFNDTIVGTILTILLSIMLSLIIIYMIGLSPSEKSMAIMQLKKYKLYLK